MEAKDLRIGNWFLADTEENNFKQINANEILDFNDDPLDDYYKPIPITEEWLLKFGFDGKDYFTDLHLKSNNYEFHYGNNELAIVQFEFGYGMFVKIKYVHQLQNIYFALTGEELTLIN